jgi:hypothetical protein
MADIAPDNIPYKKEGKKHSYARIYEIEITVGWLVKPEG